MQRPAKSSLNLTIIEPGSEAASRSQTPTNDGYDSKSKKPQPSGSLLHSLEGCSFLAFLVLALLALAAWLLHSYRQLRQEEAVEYMVLLDAGSTGTRVHVFAFTHGPSGESYPTIQLPEAKYKLEPGLSSFAANPGAVIAALQPLLAFARHHVPPELHERTPVRMMATAGVRQLSAAQQEDIMHYCRKALAASGFWFERSYAQVISGQREGQLGWTAVNYAAGGLQAAMRSQRRRRRQQRGAAPPRFQGLLELGGASVQVTFLSEEQHGLASSLGLPGVTSPVFSHSLDLGFDAILSKVLQQEGVAAAAAAAADHEGQGHPCLPTGFAHAGHVGTGDWQACQQLVAAAMRSVHCHAAPSGRQAAQAQQLEPAAAQGQQQPPGGCHVRPPDMPDLTGSFLATENFYYTAHALRLPAGASLAQLAQATQQLCSQPWGMTLPTLTAADDPHTHWRYCFGGVFVHSLLADVFQVSPEQPLLFTNVYKQADGREIGLDWALGAAVHELLREQQAGEGTQLAAWLLLAGAALCGASALALVAVSAAGWIALPLAIAPAAGGSWPLLQKSTSRVSIRVT